MARANVRPIFTLMSGAAFQIAANAAAALLATKLLPVGERGIMVLCLTVVALVSVVCAGGTGNVLRGSWPGLPCDEQRKLAILYGSVSLWSAGGAATVALIVTSVLGIFVSSDLVAPMLLLATAVAAAGQVLILQVSEAFYASGNFRSGTRWAALSALVGLIGVWVVGLVAPTAAAMTSVQAVGTLMVSIVAIIALKSTGTFVVSTRVALSEGLAFLSSGLRSMGLPIGYALISRADRLILGFFVPPSLIAVYALAVTVAEGIRLAPTAISQLATRRAAEGDSWTASWGFQKASLAVSAIVAIPVVLVVHFLAVPVFGSDFSLAPDFILIVSFSEVGYALLVVCTRGMIGARWLIDASVVAGAIGIVSVAAYIVGSAYFGVIGCCVARVVVMCAGGIWAALRLKVLYKRRELVMAGA